MCWPLLRRSGPPAGLVVCRQTRRWLCCLQTAARRSASEGGRQARRAPRPGVARAPAPLTGWAQAQPRGRAPPRRCRRRRRPGPHACMPRREQSATVRLCRSTAAVSIAGARARTCADARRRRTPGARSALPPSGRAPQHRQQHVALLLRRPPARRLLLEHRPEPRVLEVQPREVGVGRRATVRRGRALLARARGGAAAWGGCWRGQSSCHVPVGRCGSSSRSAGTANRSTGRRRTWASRRPSSSLTRDVKR
jgi:hypothetical protein